MTASPARQPSALVPVAMSLAALAAVLVHIAKFGTAPQPDEGTAAHIWQIMMAGQTPIVGFYAIKWLPQAPRTALPVLAVQVVAAAGALFPVYWLGW